MNKRISRKFVVSSLLGVLGCGTLFAQQLAPEAVVGFDNWDNLNSADAPDVIFSNLGPTSDDRYNGSMGLVFDITGRNVVGATESWYAIAFTPKVDAQATVLAAAIGYIAGTKLVDLGIYGDDDGTVGSLLPGGQGSTSQMPNLGECCQMARVRLPGEGIALAGGTRYWLVASPDNVHAPDFEGGWQFSNRTVAAGLVPPAPWRNNPGQWPAAQIRESRQRKTAAPAQPNLWRTDLSTEAPTPLSLSTRTLGQ